MTGLKSYWRFVSPDFQLVVDDVLVGYGTECDGKASLKPKALTRLVP